jgi:hypothetical protein
MPFSACHKGKRQGELINIIIKSTYGFDVAFIFLLHRKTQLLRNWPISDCLYLGGQGLMIIVVHSSVD